MKMNLIIFAKDKRLSDQLQGYIDNDNVDKTRALLDKYFPSDAIAFAHDRLVMEMGDLISSLQEADDITDYLEELRDTTNELIMQYHKEKKKAIENFNVTNYRCKTNYIGMTPQSRAEIEYTPEIVSIMLTQLDVKDAYQCYVDGYDYEKYKLYEWLRHHIDESLAGRKHETKKHITDPFKLANMTEDGVKNQTDVEDELVEI